MTGLARTTRPSVRHGSGTIVTASPLAAGRERAAREPSMPKSRPMSAAARFAARIRLGSAPARHPGDNLIVNQPQRARVAS